MAPNGVNVTQLVETVNSIKADPKLATFKFRATNTWLGGGHSRTAIQGFGSPPYWWHAQFNAG